MTKTRSIGIDYGMARIGIAYSDESKIIASPLAVIKAEKKLKESTKKVVSSLKEHQKELGYTIDVIIVGMPYMMNGTSGLMADEVNHFIAELKSSLPEVDIIPRDERLTSVQAERSMREANMNRKKRTKHVDTVSAVIILQNYLDQKHCEFNSLPPIPPIA
ncbi:MAG: Holliday junction resolvase RuvX [Chlamydiota bacterium]|nr:Holliday junction resolvase RuvX [Chlamydiota bacterium]